MYIQALYSKHQAIKISALYSEKKRKNTMVPVLQHDVGLRCQRKTPRRAAAAATLAAANHLIRTETKSTGARFTWRISVHDFVSICLKGVFHGL